MTRFAMPASSLSILFWVCALATPLLPPQARSALLLIAGLGAAMAAGHALKDWRSAIFPFFHWILLEDLFRKYNGNAPPLFFIKDVLALALYVGAWREFRREPKSGMFTQIPLLLWPLLAWALIRCIPFPAGDLRIAAVGLRMNFFFLPLLILGVAFARDSKRLDLLIRQMVLAGAFIGLAGLLQILSGMAWFNPINPDADGNPPAAFVRLYPIHRFRVENWIFLVDSLFKSNTRLALFLLLSTLLGLGILNRSSHETGRTLHEIVLVIFFSILITALYCTGTRTIVLGAVVALPPLLIFIAARHPHRRRFLMNLGLAILISGITCSTVPRFRTITRYYRATLLPSSKFFAIPSRIDETKTALSTGGRTGGLAGRGTGTASKGLQYLPGISRCETLIPRGRQAGVVEGGYTSVLWEWGAIGLGLWILFSANLLYRVLRATLRIRDDPLFAAACGFCAFLALALFPLFTVGVQSFQDYIANAWIWFFSGVVLGRSRGHLDTPCPPA